MNITEQYFEKGYIISKLPEGLISRLWAEVYTTEWLPDQEQVYKGKPSWYTAKKYNIEEDGDLQNLVEKTYGSDLISKAPKTLVETANSIIMLRDFDFLRAYKDKVELKFMHFWNGAEEIPWHFDTIDGSDTLVFVYLTEELEWKSEYGGKILFCKEVDDVKYYETILLPNNGTMVIVNNSNPLFKHKVEQLKDWSVNRYTFSFCFKWN